MQEWIDCLSIGVLFANREGKIVNANAAALGIGDFLGKNIQEVLPVKWRRIVQNGQEKRKATLSLPERIFHCSISRVVDGLVVELLDVTREKELEEDAYRDSLTKVRNPRFFEIEIRRSQRGQHFPISIIVADVNKLKEINDELGHQTGDMAIKSTAEILVRSVRIDDIVARIGGDEFAILLPDTDVETAQTIAQRIRSNAVGQEFSFAVGVATAVKGDRLIDTLRAADQQMYKEKAAKKQQ
jgi:diguanylate cyclase (GGDEF)-like protein